MTDLIGQFIRRHLLWVFLISLVMAGTPLTYMHFYLERSISAEEQTARIVNISGRQRMLSQRLTLFTNILVREARETGETRAETRQVIRRDLERMRREFNALLSGSKELGIEAIDDELVYQVYFGDPHQLVEVAWRFFNNIEKILAYSDAGLRDPIPELIELNRDAPTIVLQAADAAVKAFEIVGSRGIQELKETERQLWIATIILLILQFFVIYLPVHKLIQRQVGQLANNEKLFRSFYENSPIMLHSIDRSAKILNVSNYWLETLGYQRDEVIGKQLQDFMTAHTAKIATEKYLPQFFREGQLQAVEYQFRKKDGEVIDTLLSAQAQLDDAGNFARSFAAVVDVTKERRLQTELTKNADALNQFHKVASQSGLSHAERMNAVLRYGNVYFETSLGIVSHIDGADYKVIAVHGTNAPPPEGTILDAETTYCANLLTTGEPVAISDVSRSSFATSPSYAAYGLDSYIGAQLEVGGEFYGSIAFMAENPRAEAFDQVDTAFMKLLSQWISAAIEQDLARQQLDAAKLAAERANETKSSFLANMSHEIRTPLNAVIGLTELTLNTELTEQQTRYLVRVSQAGKNLLGVINDILDFSKIEAGKLHIEHIDFELNDILLNLSTVVTEQAEEKDLELIVWVDPGMPAVLRGDPLRLGQVLINLVGNAVKFTEYGEIVLRADIISDDNGERAIKFSVRDTGIGMNADAVARLFSPFTQADSSTTRAFGGTGLGLSISKQLVEGMGGTIWVESIEGEGSTFIFTTPLVAVSDNAPEKNAQNIDPSNTHILVVDDNKVARDLICEALTSMRFNVEQVRSGQLALERLHDDNRPKIDLILLDWRMPNMDGIETAEKIRALPNYEQTPAVFMLSAHGMDEVRTELRDLDIRVTLNKPINTSFLFDRMMEALSGTSLTDYESEETRRRLTDSPVSAKPEARLLLAEDNSLNQMVAVDVLNRAGFQVEVADNGQIAIDKVINAEDGYYDAVLMDIQMPEVDGFQATRLLRRELALKDLPIIAMTAHALAEEKEKCLAAGMNDHVSKPIDPRDLIGKLNKWIAPEKEMVQVTPATDHGASDTQIKEEEQVTTVVYNPEDAIKRLMLPRDVFLPFVADYVEKYANADEVLGDYLNNDDRTEATEYAHMIKGVSSTLGADQVSALAEQIELTLKDDPKADVSNMFKDFSQTLTATIAQMKNFTE